MQNACMQAAVAMCDVNAARILLEALGPEKQAMEFLDFWSKNAKLARVSHWRRKTSFILKCVVYNYVFKYYVYYRH